MDAFAVCLSNGMCYCSYGNREAFSASLAFGIFQAGMPLIGYFAGQSFSDAIRAFDHWIALILLGFIGGKMLLDGIRELRNPEECITKSEYTFRILLLQAIGTSIDAFAMGMGFAVMFSCIWAIILCFNLSQSLLLSLPLAVLCHPPPKWISSCLHVCRVTFFSCKDVNKCVFILDTVVV